MIIAFWRIRQSRWKLVLFVFLSAPQIWWEIAAEQVSLQTLALFCYTTSWSWQSQKFSNSSHPCFLYIEIYTKSVVALLEILYIFNLNCNKCHEKTKTKNLSYSLWHSNWLDTTKCNSMYFLFYKKVNNFLKQLGTVGLFFFANDTQCSVFGAARQ